MESYSVEAILTATDRGFSRAMGNASRSAEKAGKTMENSTTGVGKELDKSTSKAQTMNVSAMGILKAVGAYKVASAAVGLVKNSVGSAIQRVDTLNNSARTFENMGFGKGETSKAMEALKKSIQGLPTPLDAAVRGLQLLSASTGDIGKSQQIFEALNNGILGFGGSAEQVDNAVRQLSQSFSNGKVDAETWNSLIDAGMGPALNALAKTMNMTTGEMKEGLSKGTVSVEQFQDSLIELNKNGGGGLSSLQKIAQDSTKGISTSIANMKTAVSRGVANVVTGIDKALAKTDLKSISNVINQVGSAMEAGLNKFVEKIPDIVNFIGQLIDKIKEFAPVIVPLIAWFAAFSVVISIQSKINAVTKAFKAWKAATEGVTLAQKLLNAAMAMNWVGIIIAAIATLVAGFIYLWNTNEDFRNFWIGLWDSITEAVSKAVDWIKKAWDNIVKSFDNTVKWFENTWNSIKNGAKGLWDGMIQGAKDAVDSVKNTWNGIKEWFANLWQGTKDTASNAWDNVKKGASNAWEGTKSAWSNTKSWFGDIWDGVKAKSGAAWDGIVSTISPYVSTIIDIFNPMINFFTDLWKQIGDIAGAAWEVIKTVIMGPVLLLIDLITGDFNQLKEDATMLWDTLTQNIATIVTGFVQIVTGYYTALKDTLVNIWNQIVTIIQDAWLGFKVSITETTKMIVEGVISLWNNLKQGSIDAYNATIQWIKDTWSAFTTWITNTTKAVVDGIVNGWNSFKQETIDLWNATINWIKTTWNNFKQWIKTTTDNLVNGVKQGWENLKQGTVDIFNGLVNGAKQAWQNLKDSVDNVVQSVRDIFDTLRNIDLLDIGRAIIDGFVKGLKSAWEAGMEFISGIGDWIREHKGPIRVDRKLLIPAGNAIMGGLNKGLNNSFKTVQNSVLGMNDFLANAINAGGSVNIGANIRNANNSIGGTIAHEVNLNKGKQSAQINIRLGKQQFKAFVEDISQAQGWETATNNLY